ncbi:MAG: chitinase [Sediminibacterium sp.]|nr:chitinase [Sediminibacterium sp.]
MNHSNHILRKKSNFIYCALFSIFFLCWQHSISQRIEVVNGSVLPSSFTVNSGSSLRFTWVPFSGYTIDSIIVNGVSLGRDSASFYTLQNISASTIMRVVFQPRNATTIKYSPIFQRAGLPDSSGQYINYIDTSGGFVLSGITDFIDTNLWDTFFPFRANWVTTYTTWDWLSPNQIPSLDFYSFNGLLQALKNLQRVRVLIETRCNSNLWRITRYDLLKGTSKIVYNDYNFNSNTTAIDTQWVDYSKFLNEGDLTTRKRELAAFLANVSHETTGGWETAPRGRYSWGLYYKQELGRDTTDQAYTDNSSIYYPPRPGRGYIGRGPIQISWNYNYGLCSSMLFGDVALTDSATNLLLNNPGWVLWAPENAWMTAIWFWMTPQYPKPSCHNVMIPGKLTNTTNGTGMGATINIINGGIECNTRTYISTSVTDRLGFYQRYCDYFKVSYELNGGSNINNCNCTNLAPYTFANSNCNTN